MYTSTLVYVLIYFSKLPSPTQLVVALQYYFSVSGSQSDILKTPLATVNF